MREPVQVIGYDKGLGIREIGRYLPEPLRNAEQRLQLLGSHHLYALGEMKSDICESFIRRQRRWGGGPPSPKRCCCYSASSRSQRYEARPCVLYCGSSILGQRHLDISFILSLLHALFCQYPLSRLRTLHLQHLLLSIGTLNVHRTTPEPGSLKCPKGEDPSLPASGYCRLLEGKIFTNVIHLDRVPEYSTLLF